MCGNRYAIARPLHATRPRRSLDITKTSRGSQFFMAIPGGRRVTLRWGASRRRLRPPGGAHVDDGRSATSWMRDQRHVCVVTETYPPEVTVWLSPAW